MFGSGRAEQAYPILLAFSVYNPYNGGLLILLAFFLYYWVPTIGLVAFSLYCMLAFSLYCWLSPYTVGLLQGYTVGFLPILLAFSLYCWPSPYTVGLLPILLAFSLYCWLSPYTVGLLQGYTVGFLPVLLAFSLYCWPSPYTVGLLHILLALTLYCWPSPYTVDLLPILLEELAEQDGTCRIQRYVYYIVCTCTCIELCMYCIHMCICALDMYTLYFCLTVYIMCKIHVICIVTATR